jgi:hypothetical protein
MAAGKRVGGVVAQAGGVAASGQLAQELTQRIALLPQPGQAARSQLVEVGRRVLGGVGSGLGVGARQHLYIGQAHPQGGHPAQQAITPGAPARRSPA